MTGHDINKHHLIKTDTAWCLKWPNHERDVKYQKMKRIETCIRVLKFVSHVNQLRWGNTWGTDVMDMGSMINRPDGHLSLHPIVMVDGSGRVPLPSAPVMMIPYLISSLFNHFRCPFDLLYLFSFLLAALMIPLWSISYLVWWWSIYTCCWYSLTLYTISSLNRTSWWWL